MHRYRPIYPYKDEDREKLMSLAYEAFTPRRITLYCETVCEQLSENDLVCQGQCVGFNGETPVYAGISGRIDRIIKNEKSVSEKKYTFLISYEVHKNITWSQIPFLLNADGDYFLCQLGIRYKRSFKMYQDTLWIDGMESEPYATSGYRLFVENCVKVVLGADIFARYLNVTKVYFCIESQWHDVLYLLDKYMRKYESLMAADIIYEIKTYERCYPPPYVRPDRRVISPQIAIHAYHGVYEQMPALKAYITVSGSVKRCGNFIVPVGTRISDLLNQCYIDGRKNYYFVMDGVMTGKSVNVEEAVITAQNTSLYVMEPSMYVSDPCRGCGRCARVCPMGLKPYDINAQTVSKCMQCGCCSYVCPSHIRISENIKHFVNREKNGNVQASPGLKALWRNRIRANWKNANRTYWRSSNKTNGQNKAAGNHGMYLEIAPEFADFLEPMAVVSDAPPHIYEEKKKFWRKAENSSVSPVNKMMIILCLSVIIACILGLYHL